MNDDLLGESDELYDANGVRFRYPAWWELDEQTESNEVSITVSSPGTAFWSLMLLLEAPPPEHVIESVVDAYREEYHEIDIYPVDAMLCHRSNVARDLEFVCLELINSAYLRAFRTGRFTALILYQGTDAELEASKHILEEISASLECEGDDDIFGNAGADPHTQAAVED